MKPVRIELQKQMYSLGEEVAGFAQFFIESPTPYKSATISLRVREIATVAYSEGRSRRTAGEYEEFLHQEQPISLPTDKEGRIEQGEHEIYFRFTLPSQGLPSPYEGQHGRITYAVVAHVDVPNGYDLDETEEFSVSPVITQINENELVAATSGHFRDPSEPRVTFNLQKNIFEQGEYIQGKYTFRNPEAKDIGQIRINLKCVETTTAQGHAIETNLLNLESETPIERRSLHGRGSFMIRIPANAQASFETPLISVRYVLAATLHTGWRQEIQASGFIRVVATAGQLPPMRKIVEGKVETITCQNCKTVIETPYATYCPNCGAILPQATQKAAPMILVNEATQGDIIVSPSEQSERCMVCDLELKPGEDIVSCPQCGNAAHRTHLIEWVHKRHTCPMCRMNLTDADLKSMHAS